MTDPDRPFIDYEIERLKAEKAALKAELKNVRTALERSGEKHRETVRLLAHRDRQVNAYVARWSAIGGYIGQIERLLALGGMYEDKE